MDRIFGASWRTSLFGYLTGLVLTVQAMMEAGTVWPSDWPSRLKIVAGLLLAAWGRFQKDSNVSNAPMPADAMPVLPIVKT